MRIEDIPKIFDNGYNTYNSGYTGNTPNRSFTWDTSTAPKQSYIKVSSAGSNDSVISYTKVASQDSLEVMEKRINEGEIKGAIEPVTMEQTKKILYQSSNT